MHGRHEGTPSAPPGGFGIAKRPFSMTHEVIRRGTMFRGPRDADAGGDVDDVAFHQEWPGQDVHYAGRQGFSCERH